MNAICQLAQVPVRIEPSDKTEMVTQLLFGETFTVLEEKGNWIFIKMHLDGYEGWIDRKQAMNVGDLFMHYYNHNSKQVITDKAALCTCKNDGYEILLGKGCILPDFETDTFHVGERVFMFHGKHKPIPKKFHASRVASVALDYLNTPYLWGGRSIMGIDCSGLVQVVYRMCGFDMPRDANEQVKKGSVVDFVDEVLPGDLAFFDNLAGEIIHVGIIISPGKILHASGRVKIDKLDHNGIFSMEQGLYTHSLRILKRLS